MSQINRPAIDALITTAFADNGDQGITAAVMRSFQDTFGDSYLNILSDANLLGLNSWSNTVSYALNKTTVYDGFIWQAVVSSTTIGTFNANTEWTPISTYIASTSGIAYQTNVILLDNNQLVPSVPQDTDFTSYSTGFYLTNAVASSVGLNQTYPVLGKGSLLILDRTLTTETMFFYYPIANLTTYYVKKLSDSLWTQFNSGTNYTFNNGLTNNTNTVSLGGPITSPISIYANPDSLTNASINISNTSSTTNIHSNGIWLNANGINITTNNNASDSILISGSGSVFSNTIQLNQDSQTFDARAITIQSQWASIDMFNVLLTDNRNTATGFQYANDYSTNYVDRSLVDYAYVNALFNSASTSGFSQFIPFTGNSTSNLITGDLYFNNVNLYSNSFASELLLNSTGAVTLSGTGDLSISANSNANYIDLSSAAGIVMTANSNGMLLQSHSNTSYLSFTNGGDIMLQNNIGALTLDLASGQVELSSSGTLGIYAQTGASLISGTSLSIWSETHAIDFNCSPTFDADYSSSYTIRSVPDVNYVDKQATYQAVTVSIATYSIPVTNSNNIYLFNATSVSITATLPQASTVAGRKVIVTQTDANSNVVTVNTHSGEFLWSSNSGNVYTSINLNQWCNYEMVAISGGWLLINVIQ